MNMKKLILALSALAWMAVAVIQGAGSPLQVSLPLTSDETDRLKLIQYPQMVPEIDSFAQDKICDTILLQQKRDSIYAALIDKINGDSVYIPVIKHVVDYVIPWWHMEDYNLVADDPFFDNPLYWLTKTAVDDNTLITAGFSTLQCMCYFLQNEEHRITGIMECNSYREYIDQRKVYDWNTDGKQEIVEKRSRYEKEGLLVTTESVYSVINGVFVPVFVLRIQEVNCAQYDENGYGKIVKRTYERIKPDVFRITEISGRVDCNTDFSDNVAQSLLITNRETYEMTAQELLENDGKRRMYNRSNIIADNSLPYYN